MNGSAARRRSEDDSIINLVETTGADFVLADLWRHLTQGLWCVTETFSTEDSHCVIVRRSSVSRMRARTIETAGSVIRGQRTKELAFSQGITDSGVSSATHRVLSRMGLTCHLHAVPHIIVMACHADHAPHGRRLIAKFCELGATLSALTVARPRFDFSTLAQAERSTFELYLEGLPVTDIVRLRGRSAHTVQNQIQSACKKLGVSGHTEALRALLMRALPVLAESS